jgi:hypothetical protein
MKEFGMMKLRKQKKNNLPRRHRDHGVKKRNSYVFLSVLCASVVNIFSSYAQLLTPLNNEMQRRVEYEMIRSGKPFFTVMKPYYDAQLVGGARQDSLFLFKDLKIKDSKNILYPLNPPEGGLEFRVNGKLFIKDFDNVYKINLV